MGEAWWGTARKRAGLKSERRASWIALAAFFLLALAVPAGAFAGAGVTSQDRAATRALLEARYTYEQALLASAPASRAAAEQVADGLGGECPGALAGAPHETLDTFFESPGRSESARQVGESNRERRQWSDLQGELALALELRVSEADRQAALLYVRTVRSLRWSNNAVTALEHAGAGTLEWRVQSAPPAVCADMKAWAASGYKTLSPATKILISEREAVDRPLLRVLRQRRVSLPGLSDPLLAYEGSREKALAGKITELEREVESTLTSLGVIEQKLQITLGLLSQAESEMQMHEGRPNGSVQIGHGRTAAGSNYTVWFEPKQSSAGSQRVHCQISVGIYETQASSKSSGVISIGSGSSETCLSRSHPEAPSVQCRGDEGLLTIEAQTLPSARSVRLHLSDGRQITSPVAVLPAKLGGPAGFYYQVVRGPSPVPVSLTEADAHGKALRTVKLPRTAKCTKQSLKRLPGVTRTIVSGSLPQGPSFSINGERSSPFPIGGEHHRVMGETHLDLSVEAAAEGAGGITSSSGSLIAAGERARPKSSPFALQTHTGCQPHEYAILYGILKAPTDTVLARSSGSLQPFRRVRIPASLHVHGLLAYIALPALPSEVLVRTPTGKTVFTENLARSAREAKETCEGEAEGSN
jgi:hypothetical protein